MLNFILFYCIFVTLTIPWTVWHLHVTVGTPDQYNIFASPFALVLWNVSFLGSIGSWMCLISHYVPYPPRHFNYSRSGWPIAAIIDTVSCNIWRCVQSHSNVWSVWVISRALRQTVHLCIRSLLLDCVLGFAGGPLRGGFHVGSLIKCINWMPSFHIQIGSGDITLKYHVFESNSFLIQREFLKTFD